jgi:hypothetical protein
VIEPPGENSVHLPAESGLVSSSRAGFKSDRSLGREPVPMRYVTDEHATDPGAVIMTCANCGAPMDERKCKLICRCGYFLSCSDYY